MGKGRLLLISLLGLCVLIVICTIWDNYRIKVVEQEIEIENLPQEFEGFKILQISDLHEKTFGYKQERLIRRINSINYDIIALTGDLLGNADSQNYSPTYDLLDGINNKEHILFVPGNTDPMPYVVNSDQSISKNPFLLGMEGRGVQLLDSVYTVDKKNASINFVKFDLSNLGPASQL
ncbi:MAG TPA: metallophosphoesterase, partial [Metabacillus sp.]|nr:metallophosphoesterase [Metabacillus sp.]